jgi:hypothetical protein
MKKATSGWLFLCPLALAFICLRVLKRGVG